VRTRRLRGTTPARKLRRAVSQSAAAEKDPDFATVLVATGAVLVATGTVLVGAGVVLARVYENNQERRSAFLKRLETLLRAQGRVFASATFGRSPENLPVWRVTLRTAEGGVWTVRVVLPKGTEPYAATTCDELVSQVVAEVS
jgi:hypothetical protein